MWISLIYMPVLSSIGHLCDHQSALMAFLELPNDECLVQTVATMLASPHDLGQYVYSIDLGVILGDYTTGELVHGIQDDTISAHLGRRNSVYKYISNTTSSFSHLSSIPIIDESFHELTRLCPHLTSFFVDGSVMTDQSMMSLAQHCRHYGSVALETLNFTNVHGDWLALTMGDHATLMHTLVAGFSHLTHLSIHIYPTGDFLLCLVNHIKGVVWPHLTCLKLGFCGDLDDNDLISMVACLPAGLTELALTDGMYTDVTLDAMVQYLPALTYVNLTNTLTITAHGVQHLVLNCRHLVFVDLSECALTAANLPHAVLANDRYVIWLDKEAIDTIRHGQKKVDDDDDVVPVVLREFFDHLVTTGTDGDDGDAGDAGDDDGDTGDDDDDAADAGGDDDE
ncbi:unnamed protein product [Absidia cylindrospora]